MNVASGTTKEIFIPNVRINGAPLNSVGVGEYVRWTILDRLGSVAGSGLMTYVNGSSGDWRADAPMPTVAGRYTVVVTVKTDAANDEDSFYVEVDPRKVALP